MTSAGGPPTAGEWGALLSAPTIPVRELARAQVPDEPGVYLCHDWLRSCDLSWQECSTVDEADQLERRLRREYMPPLNRA